MARVRTAPSPLRVRFPPNASDIEVITGPERRRRWSAEQKQAIVAESLTPEATPNPSRGRLTTSRPSPDAYARVVPASGAEQKALTVFADGTFFTNEIAPGRGSAC